MAKIAAKPVVFRNPVSVGSDEYTAHLNKAEFVPSQPTSSWTDLDGVTTNFGGKSAYVCNLAGVQDWQTANALSDYLNDNDGEDITVTIGVTGGSWSATCIAAAVKIGGDVNQPATFDVTLQVKGKPTFTPASS